MDSSDPRGEHGDFQVDGLKSLKEARSQILEKDRRVFKKVDRFALAKEQEKTMDEQRTKDEGWVDKLFSCCSRR